MPEAVPGRIARWAALPWGDRLRIVGFALGLPIIHTSLALLGYARTRRTIEALSRSGSPRDANGTDLAYARALAKAADIAGHHGAVHATCLRQSLLIYGVLRLKGLQPELLIGMRPSTMPFQAHAWIELGGQYLLSMDEGHQPFVKQTVRTHQP